MRYLVLSDIHANREALDAVLADAASQAWDRSLILGDLVGYGADPNAVIQSIRELDPDRIVRGNHDKVVAGITDGEHFNPLARESALWTREVLEADHREWLRCLPEGPCCPEGEPTVLLSHGAPFDEEAYILGHEDALLAFELGGFRLCLFGHTHYPMVIGFQGEDLEAVGPPTVDGGVVPLVNGRRHLINPGSIGQPRDGNPRACYAILDTGSGQVEYRRVAYAVESAMARIIEAGLPAPLAARLPRGI
ncbi:MAG: metallophosphoesterase family protein [Acidobacteriota bacterium]